MDRTQVSKVSEAQGVSQGALLLEVVLLSLHLEVIAGDEFQTCSVESNPGDLIYEVKHHHQDERRYRSSPLPPAASDDELVLSIIFLSLRFLEARFGTTR